MAQTALEVAEREFQNQNMEFPFYFSISDGEEKEKSDSYAKISVYSPRKWKLAGHTLRHQYRFDIDGLSIDIYGDFLGETFWSQLLSEMKELVKGYTIPILISQEYTPEQGRIILEAEELKKNTISNNLQRYGSGSYAFHCPE